MIIYQPQTSLQHGLCVAPLQIVTGADPDSTRFSWLVAAAAAACAGGSVVETEAGDTDQAADGQVCCSLAERLSLPMRSVSELAADAAVQVAAC